MYYDKTEDIGDAIIQHGYFSNRVYLMSVKGNLVDAISKIEKIAKQNKYGKIFTKVSESQEDILLERGYTTEARVYGYYKGAEDALFMSLFLDRKRGVGQNTDEIKKVLSVSLGKDASSIKDASFSPVVLEEKHALSLTDLYKKVFSTYPFPIFEKDYIIETMRNSVIYVGVFEGNKLIGASSAETDRRNESAEMTDFAVLPEYRGHRLASILLDFAEKKAIEAGIQTAYTIARSISYGMNSTFTRGNYRFSGTLINNTFIDGSIESMNVYCKKLS